MTVISYPSAVDYTLALQHPAAAFSDTALRTAKFTEGVLGPYGIAGSSAVVFHATIGAEEYALRCYTRQDASSPERYAALDSFVSGNGLSRQVGIVTWYEDQVKVKGALWPVLKMEWIAGQQLNEYVGYHADQGNGPVLGTLAARWLELVEGLQRVSFAHGDLQHGNILVDQAGQLRLVDFDSVWIPALQGQKAPSETGHGSYQPYGANGQLRWGPFMDTFSGLVIYLALLALARDPGLWGKFNNGDNLLFEPDDFTHRADTKIWTQLAGLKDADVDRVAVKLKDCCAPGWTASKTLQDTLNVRASVSMDWWNQPGLAKTAGTAETATPLRAQPPASQPVQWYAPSVPAQAPPSGSLPGASTSGYQSTVAKQTTETSGSATWEHAKGGKGSKPGKTHPWYGQQTSTGSAKTTGTSASATTAAASKTSTATPAKKGEGAGAARSAFGVLFIVAAIIVFLALTAHHDAGVGAIVGGVLFITGIAVADVRPKKPPAAGGGTTPPASGGT